MLDGFALPIVCAARAYSFMQWFACLKEIMHHPLLSEEEKFLWLWLAIQSADNSSFACSYSYEQISQALNKSTKIIHRTLFRLKIMGFLSADIPIWYGQPTAEMVCTIRMLKLHLSPQSLFEGESANTGVLPKNRKSNEPVLINLIRRG